MAILYSTSILTYYNTETFVISNYSMSLTSYSNTGDAFDAKIIMTTSAANNNFSTHAHTIYIF